MGPTLIESVSLRWKGHAGHDPAKYVPKELLEEYMRDKDPVKNFERYLLVGGRRQRAGRRGLQARIEKEFEEGYEFAQASPFPEPRGLHEGPVGRGRVLDERARPRRRHRGLVMSQAQNTRPEKQKTEQVEAGAAGHGAEPRGKRTEDGQATYLVAIAEALWEEMERDERVYMLGEDIGVYGGAFKVTEGFYDRFGRERVIDTPIAEETIVGMAIGSAMEGFRPVAEFQYSDFMTSGFDEISTALARVHYRSGVPLPVVLRGPSGRHGPRLVLPLDQPGAVVRVLGRDQDRLPRLPGGREGSAEVRDPRRQPRDVPRAQVDLPADPRAGPRGSRLPRSRSAWPT